MIDEKTGMELWAELEAAGGLEAPQCTSRMQAITDPKRWGFTRMKNSFVEHEIQTCFPGDVIRRNRDGKFFSFVAREGMTLEIGPLP